MSVDSYFYMAGYFNKLKFRDWGNVNPRELIVLVISSIPKSYYVKRYAFISPYTMKHILEYAVTVTSQRYLNIFKNFSRQDGTTCHTE